MKTQAVTDANFEVDVLQSPTPVVVDFWAEWCGPCRMIAPIMDELAKDYDGRVKIAKIDIENNPKVASKLGIRSIPALMIFKDGKLAAQRTGATSKIELTKWINSAI